MQARKSSKTPRAGRPRKDGRPPIGRLQILNAAAQLFAIEGYAGTSMRDICAKLGVVPSSVFHQFKTKLAILEGIVAVGMQAELDYYRRLADSGARAAVQIYRIISADVSLIAQFDLAQRRVLGLPEVRNPRFKKIYRLRLQTIDHLTQLLREGIQEGDFRDLNTAIIGEIVVILSELPAYVIGKLGDPDKLADELSRFVFAGILIDIRKLEAIKGAAEKLPRGLDGAEWAGA